MTTSSRLVHPLNTPLPTLVTVAGRGLYLSAEQPLNELRAMVTQVAGNVSDVRLRQSTKALAAVATTVYSVPS